MTIRPFAAAAIAVSLLASPVYAQTFTGPRIEATAGWDQVSFDLARYSIAGSSKRSALIWGVAAGYDVPLGRNFIAGLETGVSFSNADQGFTDGTTSYLMHARRDIELSGRLGAIVGGRALIYGKAGYTNFQVGSDVTTAGVGTAQRVNLDGFRLGAGAELALSKAAYLKAEYRYSNYQDGVTKNDVLTGLGIRF